MKLTKTQREEWAGYRRLLLEHHRKVEAAYRDALVELALLERQVNLAVGAYNQALARARKFCVDLGAELRCELDGKSDAWAESERGQAAEEFVSAWEEADGDLRPLAAVRFLEPDPPDLPALADLPCEVEA